MKDINLEYDLRRHFPDLIIQNSQPLHSFMKYKYLKNMIYKEDFHMFINSKIDYLLSDPMDMKPLLALNLRRNQYDALEIKNSTFIYRILTMSGIPFIQIEEEYTEEAISSLRLYLYLQNKN